MAQMQLPAYRVPRNALLDLAPINEAIDTGIRTRQMGVENDFRREQMDMQKARMTRADQKDDADIIGEAASSFAQLPPEQRNPAAWDRVLRRHPEYNGLGPEYRDPVQGPALVAAEYGKYKAQKPEAPELRTVGNALVSIPRGGQPQVVYTAPEKKSPLEIIMEAEAARKGSQPKQYQPMPQGGPRLQQQSSTGEVMPGGVTLANDPASTEMPAAPAAPQERMIDVPMFGPRTESEARDLAFKLSTDPRTAAMGRMIADMIGPQSNPAGLQKPTVNAIEELQRNAVEKLSRLEDIEKAFDPKFLTAPEQAKQIGMSWVAWLTGKLPPEQEKSRREYVTWQRRTIANVNATIKEITGAAMSESEAKRIRMQEADLRNDPIQFKTQLDDALRDTRLALARMHILKREGFQGAAEQAAKRLSLSDVEGRMEQRFVEIQKQIRNENPNMTPQEMRSRVRMQLRTEFGVDA